MASTIAQFLPFPELLRLRARHAVDPRFRKRLRARLIFSALIEPLRCYERLRYGALLRRTRISEPPLFILGFGRSGTTHLHNLMWKDGRFGVVTNYQANMHPIALCGRGWLDRYFADKLPKKRPMDNVALSLDGPQEEEIALANLTADAPLHFMSFSHALPDIYERWVTDLGRDAGDLAIWKRAYMDVLKKATVLSGGRRLVLKTPPNTGRIPALLELFPEARFVHIVRDPYPVFQSMRNMYRKVLPGQELQSLDWDRIDAWVVDAYRRLMTKYLADRTQIPAGRLVEIRYEDLDARPLEILPALYASLELPDFEVVRPQIESYLEGLGRFEKNRFEYPDEVVESVNRHWGFALEAFGYERREPSGMPVAGGHGGER
jgi:hypothetical protein